MRPPPVPTNTIWSLSRRGDEGTVGRAPQGAWISDAAWRSEINPRAVGGS